MLVAQELNKSIESPLSWRLFWGCWRQCSQTACSVCEVHCYTIILFSCMLFNLFSGWKPSKTLKLLKMCVYVYICTCNGSEGYWLPERLPKQLVGKLQDTRKPLVCLNIQIFSPLLRCKNILSMCSLFFQICPCKQRTFFSASFPCCFVLLSTSSAAQLSWSNVPVRVALVTHIGILSGSSSGLVPDMNLEWPLTMHVSEVLHILCRALA